MWPKALESWWEHCEPEAVKTVWGRLKQYGSMDLFRERTVRTAVARARQIATYLAEHDDYFANSRQFCRWLCEVAYRESLRLLLPLEPIENALQKVSPEVRRLLKWCYVDQLTEQEVARMLDLPTDKPGYYDSAEAQRRMIDAYNQLSAEIVRRFRPPNFVERGPYRNYSNVFPSPPTLTRPALVPSPKGQQP